MSTRLALSFNRARPAAEGPAERVLPDYLPARMVNEYVYCPRLFYFMWVDQLFAENVHTVEGTNQHKRVDRGTGALPEAGDIEDAIHARSVTLASERLRVIAKIDLVEADEGIVCPVDYKHGRPVDGDEGLGVWPADRVQLVLQALVLRENGYQCEEAVAYYQKTKQRVRVAVNAESVADAERAVAEAWRLAEGDERPAPLVDSPKCPGCYMVGICLPDETNALLAATGLAATGVAAGAATPVQLEMFRVEGARKPAKSEVRTLVSARVETKPVYLNTQGLRVGKSGGVLQVKEKDAVVQEARINEICQLNLMGNIQVSTQAVQALCEAEVPVCYFSQGGWFYGITQGMGTKNVMLRRAQFAMAEEPGFGLAVARRLVAGKIRNQRVLMQRNHREPPPLALAEMKKMADRAEVAASLESLLGIEGNGARVYFGEFAGMLKGDDGEQVAGFARFDFDGRNRRPPRDPVNALLSLAYSVLAKDFTVACYSVGFDPMIGFYHQPRFGRPALALDLMEPFRALVADSAVLSAVNTRMVTERDFVRAAGSVALTPGGRKGFFRAYEARMDTLVTHPLFDYRVSYRRMLEIQARLLAKYVMGEIGEYPVFVTR